MARLWQRAIRPPPDDVTPNPNDPASVPPATVGPPAVSPGDPHGLLVDPDPPAGSPPAIRPSAWSGWPSEWYPPAWNSWAYGQATGIAWTCLDINSFIFSSMNPYLVNAVPSLSADWLRNPDPELYTAWDEFARRLWWDYQCSGEAFVLATARYSTGWPARFHVVPPWYVNVEMGEGRRRYTIGSVDVTENILPLRYQSTVDDAHGHGPLEAGGEFLLAAKMLTQYATGIASAGGIPASVLTHPEELSAEQALELRQQWVAARQSSLGEPAVLSGGVKWEPTQMNPKDMSMHDMLLHWESRIAVMLKVPPHQLGLPSGGDSMTYANVNALFDYHWRALLRPLVNALMSGLSEWLVPRGTTIEVNENVYVQPDPLQRAQIAQILNSIQDADGNPALTVEQIQQAERLTNATPQEGAIR